MAGIVSLIRYRFFLFAGIFPYLLGQILGFSQKRSLNWQNFWLGFLGIFLVLVGVELFNEYFDAKEGGDRIFLEEKASIPAYFYPLGIFVFVVAFFIGLYLCLKVGWIIFLFSFLGFLGAYFYVGPPIRWAYRGWGELVIALSYGPLMVLGSYYLQTKRIEILPLFISLILGLLIFSLAIVNEIPDYFQDKLAGKKNIVVRLGRQAAYRIFALSLVCAFLFLGIGIVFKIIPFSSIIAFLWLPLISRRVNLAQENFDSPLSFLPAIRTTILTYILIVGVLSIGYLSG